MGAPQSNVHTWMQFKDAFNNTCQANVKLSLPPDDQHDALSSEQMEFIINNVFTSFVYLIRAMQKPDEYEPKLLARKRVIEDYEEKYAPFPKGLEPVILIWCDGKSFSQPDKIAITPTMTEHNLPSEVYRATKALRASTLTLAQYFNPTVETPPQNFHDAPQQQTRLGVPQPPQAQASGDGSPRHFPYFDKKQSYAQDEIITVDVSKVEYVINKKGNPQYELFGGTSKFASVFVDTTDTYSFGAIGDVLLGLNLNQPGQSITGSWLYTARINISDKGTVYFNPVKLEVKS